MSDIDLDAPPAVSRRSLLKKAKGNLWKVATYPIRELHKADLEELKEALHALELALKEDRT